MTRLQRNRRVAMSALVAVAVCVAAARVSARQEVVPTRERAEDAAAFKDFSARVQAYQTLQRAVESGLPSLKPTDLPEMIVAHQQALARKLREARPHAKEGDLFTRAACEAFRHASRAALTGVHPASTRAYMHAGEATPAMKLAVNGIYPDIEPITALSPELLASLPTLPAEVAYRVVGRTLIVVDVKSRLVVDLARLILPPPT
jgi:hypothetical protein